MFARPVPASESPPTRLRSPWRFAAAAMCVVAAASHLPVTEDHLREAPYIGVLFVLLSVSCLVLAVLLLRRDSRLVWSALAATCAAAVAAFVWSRAIGLPQITDDVGHWTEPLALVAITSESLAVLMAVGALRGPRSAVRGAATASTRPALLAAVLLVFGLGWTGIAAASQAQHPDMGAMGAMSGNGAGYWNAVGGGPFVSDGVTRTYYVSADLVVWDYAPDGKNDITGEPFDAVADTYVRTGPGRIGSRNLKCLYRGYSDAAFDQLEARPAADQYLGLLGPIIRAEVGDTIRIVFRNTCPFATSMHPHGVLYSKSSEGAPYDDGTTTGADKADDAVATGAEHTYVWEVPERAGPGPHDGSSVMWMYHSHTDEVGDTYAGLMGPIEITGRGLARPDGSPKDVDREVFALFSVMNENNSPLLSRNEHRFETPYQPVRGDDEAFEESNLKHSINGYVFGNQPMITVGQGERVRWYVMSMGTEVDLHTPHWHGNDVTVGGMRMDVVSLLPASMVVADMVPDNPGVWLFHCHVNDHIRAGMLTRYTVTP